MRKVNTVEVFSVDNSEPVTLNYQVLNHLVGNKTLPYVLYSLDAPDETANEAINRTALYLPGGGSSGVQFARVAKMCAAYGVRVYMLDLPGHTPDGLIPECDGDIESGASKPDKHWLKYLNYSVRSDIIDVVLEQCLSRASNGKLDVIAHSAGFLDASNISSRFIGVIENIYVLASRMPGFQPMLEAYRAASQAGSESKHNLFDVIRTKSIATGEPAIHFGFSGVRSSQQETLVSYQGSEHYSVILRLLREKSFGREIWQGVRVCIIASDGDKIAPPIHLENTANQLSRLGAKTETYVLPCDFPHMFMMFEEGARFVSQVIEGCPGDELVSGK